MLGESLPNLSQVTLLHLDLTFSLAVAFFLAIETALVLLELVLLAVEPVLGFTVLFSRRVDQLVTSTTVFNGVLPLKVKLMALLMETLELLSSLIQLNLSGLSLSDLLLQLISLTSNLDGELLDLKGQLLDLCLVSSSILLEGQVIFFLLSSSEGPLLEFFLVPVHFQFELVHALVGLEDHVLDVVEPILLISDSLLQLFDLVFKAARLTLGDLLEMLFSFNFFVFGVDETLSVHELHLDRLQMLVQNL